MIMQLENYRILRNNSHVFKFYSLRFEFQYYFSPSIQNLRCAFYFPFCPGSLPFKDTYSDLSSVHSNVNFHNFEVSGKFES